jgi:hypothetical protein
MDEVREKQYPENYPEDALSILKAMSFTGGKTLKVVGSVSVRSQQYAGDYDAYEVVNTEGAKETALNHLADQFQKIVKQLRSMKDVIIGDIKSGSVEEWRVLSRSAGVMNGKVVHYNAAQSRRKIDELFADGIITKGEANEAHELLKEPMTPVKLLVARNTIKFHTVRWTVHDVLQGYVVLRDKSCMTLQEAFSSPAKTKLDTIGLVQRNRYTDFSVIYEFHNNGVCLNPDRTLLTQSLREDILYYTHEGNPFKALKRRFTLAKAEHNVAEIKKLTPILNSDLGRLYTLVTDIETLLAVLETKPPSDVIRYEIDQFKSRLGQVYSISSVVRGQHDILGEIEAAMKTTSKPQMIARLQHIHDTLQPVLSKNTPKI